MFKTKCVTPGIAFGPVDPSAFNGRYNAISAGPALQNLGTVNIFTEFKPFRAGKLPLVNSSLYSLFTETATGSCLCGGGS